MSKLKFNKGEFVAVIIITILLGMVFLMAWIDLADNNMNADIGLSQEAGDLICQKLTNNSEAYAVDWKRSDGEPVDSLICKTIESEKGLIRIDDE